jgi:hypothetical protein
MIEIQMRPPKEQKVIYSVRYIKDVELIGEKVMNKSKSYFIKTASVLLLSAVLLFSATAVMANTGTISKHSIQKISDQGNSTPNKPLSRFDDIIWDMVLDESWDTFEYRELTFDISSYAGQPIQIAWRYVGIDGESFGLDDITVTADSSPILIQGFEEGIMPPTGWSVINTNPTRNWDIVDVVTYPTYVHSGSYAGWVNYDTPNPSDEWLITPIINLTGFTTISIDFWAESDTGWPTATMQLHILGGGGEDTTPPVTTCTLTGTMQGGVYITDVTATLTATDDMSGVNYTMYKIDNGVWTMYSVPFIITGNGEHTIYFYSVDNAGNIETTKTSVFTIQYPLQITIKGGLGITATIKNNGTTDLTGLTWKIELSGGIILIGKTKTGTVDIAAGSSVTEKDFVFGFGKPTITVTAGDISATATGTVILFFVIGV